MYVPLHIVRSNLLLIAYVHPIPSDPISASRLKLNNTCAFHLGSEYRLGTCPRSAKENDHHPTEFYADIGETNHDAYSI